jgi:hypothetical protein
LKEKLVYLEFVISNEGFKMDYEKVKDILEWPSPKCTFDVRSFDGLASFYKKLFRNFNEICASLTECMKNGIFKWTTTTMKSFEDLKKKVIEQRVLALPDSNKAFQVDCDASGSTIGAFLSQEDVDDCSYVRHSPGHKSEREPLRGVCGSYQRQSWNIEMASSLQRVDKNSI